MDVNMQIVLLRNSSVIWTRAKNPLRSVIFLLPPFHWIGKTMAFKVKVFNKKKRMALVGFKKQNSLSSPNLEDSFDTKTDDPPHEI